MRAVRCGAIVALAAIFAFTVGGAVAAHSIDSGAPPRVECNPCPLTRTVVDKPAWDETVSVVDRPAWDETVTVVDQPATTAYRTVVDTPARAIAHHELVSPAQTVARQVLIPAHTESYQVWVPAVTSVLPTLLPAHYTAAQVWQSEGHYGYVWTPSGYWGQVWVSSGYWGQQWVGSGYWGWRWASSGYWGAVWVPRGYWGSQWVASGYWGAQWISNGGYWETDCEGPDRDAAAPTEQTVARLPRAIALGAGSARPQLAALVPSDTAARAGCYTYWVATGYWGSVWVDTSYWASVWVDTSGYQTQWLDTSHYESYWLDTSHYQTQWIDTSHYQTQWIDTSGYAWQWIDTSHYVLGGSWVGDTYITADTYVDLVYWYSNYHCWGHGDERDCDGDFAGWVHAPYIAQPQIQTTPAHYEARQRWIDDAYTTVYDTIPAVYNDWLEQVPAVTHQEPYAVPAVTHTALVHHAAVTHTEIVHHPALTHEVAISPDELLTQNRQSATASSADAAQNGSTASALITVPVVSSITIVDRAGYTARRTVVDRAAWDETVQTPVWGTVWHCWGHGEDRDCDESQGVTGYAASVVHHDAITHLETAAIPALTHQETLRYDATIADSAPAGSRNDPLLDFALLAGLTALAGAGRYASRGDSVRVALAEWSGAGRTVPSTLVPLVRDGVVTDTEAAAAAQIVSAAMSLAGGRDQSQGGGPGPTPPPPRPEPNTPTPTPLPRPGDPPRVDSSNQSPIIQVNGGLGKAIVGVDKTLTIVIGVGAWVTDTESIGGGPSLLDPMTGSITIGGLRNPDGSLVQLPADPELQRAIYEQQLQQGLRGPEVKIDYGVGSLTVDADQEGWNVSGRQGVSIPSITGDFGSYSRTMTLEQAIAESLPVQFESAVLSAGEDAIIGTIDYARWVRDTWIAADSAVLSAGEDAIIDGINTGRSVLDGVITAESSALSAGENLVIGAIDTARDVKNFFENAIGGLFGSDRGSDPSSDTGSGGSDGSCTAGMDWGTADAAPDSSPIEDATSAEADTSSVEGDGSENVDGGALDWTAPDDATDSSGDGWFED